MRYLPSPNIEDENIPIPLGKDFWHQAKMAVQKWNRGFYPLIPYTQIVKSTTMEPGAPTGQYGPVPVGAPGTTSFDPLYGEAVDPAMTTWTQPHQSGTLKAADPEVYAPPVNIRMRVQVELQDIELHFYGFESVIDVVGSIPVALLDQAGITCQPGDKFPWGGDWYEVEQIGPKQRWLNTTTALYLFLNCRRKRFGA